MQTIKGKDFYCMLILCSLIWELDLYFGLLLRLEGYAQSSTLKIFSVTLLISFTGDWENFDLEELISNLKLKERLLSKQHPLRFLRVFPETLTHTTPIFEWLHCFQWDQYHQHHCRVVATLMLTLGLNGP